MDFAFFGREDDPQKTVPALVVKERTSKMVMSAAVPRKTTGTYISRRVIGYLREVGCLHGDVIVKSDQEPVLRSIVEEVGRLKATDGSGRYVIENSLVGASQSNGMIERQRFKPYLGMCGCCSANWRTGGVAQSHTIIP